MSKHLSIGDNFEILLSQNNLVRHLRIKKISINHCFDEDRDYEHKDLKDWEIHGKMDRNEIMKLVNIKGYIYKFYYSNEQHAIFNHTLRGELQIIYESNEFDTYEKYEINYTKEEFDVIKPELINLI